ncbi:MAG: hypothetical protein UH851_03600, partial [Clostridia bacterium]|nr:hypothetical protein [Clostridia bacterium]
SISARHIGKNLFSDDLSILIFKTPVGCVCFFSPDALNCSIFDRECQQIAKLGGYKTKSLRCGRKDATAPQKAKQNMLAIFSLLYFEYSSKQRSKYPRRPPNNNFHRSIIPLSKIKWGFTFILCKKRAFVQRWTKKIF